VLETLHAAASRPNRASGALRQASREARKLRSRERRALWDVAYALIRSRTALGAPPQVEATDWGPLLDAWLLCETDPWNAPERTPAERLGVPPSVAAQLQQRFDPIDSWLNASNQRAPTFVRVHARRDRAAVAAELARSDIDTTPVGAYGLVVEGRANLVGHAAYRRGAFELQDLGSQQVAEAAVAGLDAPTVLDLCAGAGGKALAMAALGARVTATDVRGRPLAELTRRAARAGDHIRTREVGPDPRTLSDLGTHDVVLVDAPCSGTGVWRRHPEYRWRFTPEGRLRTPTGPFPDLAGLQLALLARGAAQARKRLVYATCSVLHAENEAIVDAFLDATPGWERATPDTLADTTAEPPAPDGLFTSILVPR
jgi:16S rRNA (cytosine967-C5)-methyltransferase